VVAEEVDSHEQKGGSREVTERVNARQGDGCGVRANALPGQEQGGEPGTF